MCSYGSIVWRCTRRLEFSTFFLGSLKEYFLWVFQLLDNLEGYIFFFFFVYTTKYIQPYFKMKSSITIHHLYTSRNTVSVIVLEEFQCVIFLKHETSVLGKSRDDKVHVWNTVLGRIGFKGGDTLLLLFWVEFLKNIPNLLYCV